MMHAPGDNGGHPGVIFPPPLLYAIGVILAVGLDHYWPLPAGLHGTLRWAGAVMMTIGVALNLWGAWSMRRARTPINPYRTVTGIVDTGAFRVTRNPLYLGLDLVFVGLFAWLDNAWGLVVFAGVAAVMHYGVILREERYLEGRFGQAYRDYRNRVRRYL